MRAFLSGEKPPAETPEHSVLLKEGWLKKEGANVKSWKQRYFKLYANRLEYYRNRHVIGPMVPLIFTHALCFLLFLCCLFRKD